MSPEEDRRPGGPRAAAELAALVRDSVTANAVREVLHLRLSSLGRQPRHQKLLREALEPVLGAARGRVFDLPNGDVVAVAPPPARVLEVARQALLRALDSQAEEMVQAMSLPGGAARLLAIAAESLGLDQIQPPPPPAAGSKALGGEDLAAAEAALAQADLTAMTIAQAVCHLAPEAATAAPRWEDRRLDWPRLVAALLPGVAEAESSALWRRLARAAEARLLAGTGRPGPEGWRPVGLPLVPASLATPAFHRFDMGLPAGRRQEITLAFRPADILADPAGFAAARDMARRRGYRLALDDAPAALLALLPAARLELDILRLRWSPSLPAAMPPGLDVVLRRPESVVLVGVDRPAAIAWGWQAGIRLFQGPLVERRRG